MSAPTPEHQPRLFDEPASPPAAPAPPAGKRRLRVPERHQIECQLVSLDALLEPEHPVRSVWDFVCGLGLTELTQRIEAREGAPGHPALDPRLGVALWLYATCRGISSARELDRRCTEDVAFRWLCGGVTTNYHTLSDFRVRCEALLDQLLTDSVTVLLHQGLVTLDRVAQDGMRVRANAGAASFRREATLEAAYAEASAQVQALAAEREQDPSAGSRRQRAARERAARERCEGVEQALAEMPEVTRRKKKRAPKPCETPEETAKRTAPRVSTTDPEARVMKQADGGFRPSYNINLATDCTSQVVVGVAVTNVGSDHGLLLPMAEQIEARYGQRPGAMLADNGYDRHADIEALEEGGTEVYLPPQLQPKRGMGRYERAPGESEAIGRWRERMGTEEGQTVYRERAATAECVNAQMRNRGLRQLPVRGLAKVRTVALWHALAHNVLRAIALGVTLG